MATTLVRRPLIIAAICLGVLFFLWHGIVRKSLTSHGDILSEVTEDYQGKVNASRPPPPPPSYPSPVVCPSLPPPPPPPPSPPPPNPYDPAKYLRGRPTPHLKGMLHAPLPPLAPLITPSIQTISDLTWNTSQPGSQNDRLCECS